MAFNTNKGRQSFTAIGGQTDFDFNFKIYEVTDMRVYLTPVGSAPEDTDDILTYGSDYTISIDGDDGGTVILVSGVTLGDIVVCVRDLPKTRDISYITNGDLKAATLNEDQNYQTYLLIDGFDVKDRAVVLPATDVTMAKELPSTIQGGYLKVKADGSGFEYDDTVAATGRSQLRAWEAEAEKLTADSYATEAVGVPVNIVTSNGDGTFTYTPTSPIEYSALHWAAQGAWGYNYLWQGTFKDTSRGQAFKPDIGRTAIYDGWTIATLADTLDKHYIIKKVKGVKVYRVIRETTTDSIVLVANLSKELSKELIGKSCYLDIKVAHGDDYAGAGATVKVQASNRLEQPITNNEGTYTNGNVNLLSFLASEGLTQEQVDIPDTYEQVAVTITIPFSGTAGRHDYVDIEFVSLGLNSNTNPSNIKEDYTSDFYVSSYPRGSYIGTPTSLGGIARIAVAATTITNKILQTVRTDLKVPVSVNCYGTDGQDLEMYDVDADVSKYAMIENVADSGFTIRNNEDITIGNRVEFHYISEGVL